MSIFSTDSLKALEEKYRFKIFGHWTIDVDGEPQPFIDLEFLNVTRAVLFHNSFCQVFEMEFADGPIDFHEKAIVTVWEKGAPHPTEIPYDAHVTQSVV